MSVSAGARDGGLDAEVSIDAMSKADVLLWLETSGSVSASTNARVGGLHADISSGTGT